MVQKDFPVSVVSPAPRCHSWGQQALDSAVILITFHEDVKKVEKSNKNWIDNDCIHPSLSVQTLPKHLSCLVS